MQAFDPGCCCDDTPPEVDPCLLHLDHFDRDDGSLGSDWTVIGTAAIASEAARFSSDGAIAISAYPNPDGPYTFIRVLVKLNNSGARAQVYFGRNGAGTQYLYAFVETSQIVAGAAGVSNLGSTSASVSLSLNTWYELTACYNGNIVLARINGVTVFYDGSGLGFGEPTGGDHGIGSPLDVVEFDDYEARIVSEDCMQCGLEPEGVPCSYCADGEMYPYYVIDLDGVANSPGTPPFNGSRACGDCTDLNRTWITYPYPAEGDIPGGAGACQGFQTSVTGGGFTMDCGTGPENWIVVFRVGLDWARPPLPLALTGLWRMSVFFGQGSGELGANGQHEFKQTFATEQDCLTLLSGPTSLPLVSDRTERVDDLCDESAATVTVSFYTP